MILVMTVNEGRARIIGDEIDLGRRIPRRAEIVRVAASVKLLTNRAL